MNRYDEITGKLGIISVEMAKLTSKFATASAEELEPLTEKVTKLEDKKKGLLLVLQAMRNQERLERDAAEKATQEKERKRKETLFAQIQKEGRDCPKCGAKGRLVDTPTQPEGYMSDFWTKGNIPRHWWLSWTCSREPQISCGFRWRWYPDLPDDAPENGPEGKA